jgi:hypothetical protein
MFRTNINIRVTEKQSNLNESNKLCEGVQRKVVKKDAPGYYVSNDTFV